MSKVSNNPFNNNINNHSSINNNSSTNAPNKSSAANNSPGQLNSKGQSLSITPATGLTETPESKRFETSNSAHPKRDRPANASPAHSESAKPAQASQSNNRSSNSNNSNSNDNATTKFKSELPSAQTTHPANKPQPQSNANAKSYSAKSSGNNSDNNNKATGNNNGIGNNNVTGNNNGIGNNNSTGNNNKAAGNNNGIGNNNKQDSINGRGQPSSAATGQPAANSLPSTANPKRDLPRGPSFGQNNSPAGNASFQATSDKPNKTSTLPSSVPSPLKLTDKVDKHFDAGKNFNINTAHSNSRLVKSFSTSFTKLGNPKASQSDSEKLNQINTLRAERNNLKRRLLNLSFRQNAEVVATLRKSEKNALSASTAEVRLEKENSPANNLDALAPLAPIDVSDNINASEHTNSAESETTTLVADESFYLDLVDNAAASTLTTAATTLIETNSIATNDFNLASAAIFDRTEAAIIDTMNQDSAAVDQQTPTTKSPLTEDSAALPQQTLTDQDLSEIALSEQQFTTEQISLQLLNQVTDQLDNLDNSALNPELTTVQHQLESQLVSDSLSETAMRVETGLPQSLGIDTIRTTSPEAFTATALPKENLKLPLEPSYQPAPREKFLTLEEREALPGFGVLGNREAIEAETADAGQNNGAHSGIPAPFDEWAGYIYESARRYQLEPALLAGLIWCESAGKNIVSADGNKRGLLQIDVRQHFTWLQEHQQGMDAASNIDFGASLLRDHINYFRGHLAAGIAAYNCGPNAVVEALANSKSPDYFTTDRNYSARVQGYADYLRRFFAD